METNKIKKIIWAVDPFAKEQQSQLNALRTIQTVLSGQVVSIEPVYLAYSFSFYPTSAGQLQMRKEAEREASRLFDKLMKHADRKNVLPFHIVRGGVSSYRECARSLLIYAKECKADLIALSTHARKGVGRWFLGSFAESLMVESPIPLLVTNPLWKPTKKVEDILFTTDFSAKSKAAYEDVLDFAKTVGLQVTIYYKFPEVFTATMMYPIGTHTFYEETFAREFAEKSRIGEEWVKEAKLRGVRVELEIDKNLRNSTAKSILKQSAKTHSIIALASEETFLTRVLLGSTVRKVLRASHFPVWIVRPDPGFRLKKSKEASKRTHVPARLLSSNRKPSQSDIRHA